MSFYNKDKNPFPFYQLEGEVWTNFKPLWFMNRCGGCCYEHVLYPGVHYFQLPLSEAITNPSQISNINLRLVSDNTILASDIDGTVYFDSAGNKYLLINVTLNPADVGEKLYVGVETNLQRYYSEVFCLNAQYNKQIQIDWAIEKGKVGNMLYTDDFRHRINVTAVILPTEPQIEEETEEDGFGNEVPTLQILKQSFFMSFMVPNFLAQAISAIPLHDQYSIVNRLVGDEDLGYDQEIKNIQVVVSPEQDGCMSFVEFTFTKETITKTACDDKVVSLNDAFVELVWDDDDSITDRFCDLTVVSNCNQTIRAIATSPDIDITEIQKSSNFGGAWGILAVDTETLLVNPTVQGVHWYRLKVVYSDGTIVYSNTLVHSVNTTIGG